ncbi:MAG: adenine deaminase [Williamsia sp.]|nr:adenine deaminase [Williamsia sp.]
MPTITGQLVDLPAKKIYPATILIENGKIVRIEQAGLSAGSAEASSPLFILPGFIDAHVHIESSMLIPSEFARLAVVHGTVGTVSDPHEIANVCGMEGVGFMIENGNKTPFKFNFGAPSCVPATHFETAGARLPPTDVAALMDRPEIRYLSEMMNFPGVLNKDAEVMEKIAAAHERGKPVDGHAPGLRGLAAKQYIDAGISTDHECFTREEALDKLQYGMHIIIREGSAAKNFEALIELLHEYPDKIMFGSDDKHPDSLVSGHINQLCARAVQKGIDPFKVLQAACINPVLHYKLDIGLLRENDPADFILVRDLRDFQVAQTYINGELVAENGQSAIPSVAVQGINNFQCSRKNKEDFRAETSDLDTTVIPVIEALDGQLITNKLTHELPVENGEVSSDPDADILKIVVVNRYHDAPVAKAFIKNFGLKQGAIASSVAHDSHNIVAVGADDESLCRAVNRVIEEQGGISCVKPSSPEEGSETFEEQVLPLPVAGLMSADDGYKVAEAYMRIDAMAKSLGSPLAAPFMTLSFMSLLVIPHLKLSDKGLFDGDTFTLI